MQPPRPAAIARGKLSSRVCSKYSRVQTKTFSRYASSFSPYNFPARLRSAAAAFIGCRISLVEPGGRYLA